MIVMTTKSVARAARATTVGVASLAVVFAPAVTAPRPAAAAMVHTSYGAHYDPAKCSLSARTWNGNRRFYVSTATNYGCFTSKWYKGKHAVMLSYGRTSAPWYASHVHHGIDIDMPVGTPIYSRRSGKVLVRPVTMGTAYGSNRMLVRSGAKDYALGHMSKLVVRDKQWVKAGQLLGYSGMNGVEKEDGPHLHFEVRPAGTRYSSAVDPWTYLNPKRV